MFKNFLLALLIIFFPFFVPFASVLLVIFVVVRLIKIANNQLIEEPKLTAERMLFFKEVKFEERPQRSPDNFVFYKDCLIESFANGNLYRVLTPEVVDIGRSFSSLKQAKTEIDLAKS